MSNLTASIPISELLAANTKQEGRSALDADGDGFLPLASVDLSDPGLLDTALSTEGYRSGITTLQWGFSPLTASLSMVLDNIRVRNNNSERGVIVKLVNDTEFFLGLDAYGHVWNWNYITTDGASGRQVVDPAASIPPGGAVVISLPQGSNTATVHGPVVPVVGTGDYTDTGGDTSYGGTGGTSYGGTTF